MRAVESNVFQSIIRRLIPDVDAHLHPLASVGGTDRNELFYPLLAMRVRDRPKNQL